MLDEKNCLKNILIFFFNKRDPNVYIYMVHNRLTNLDISCLLKKKNYFKVIISDILFCLIQMTKLKNLNTASKFCLC